MARVHAGAASYARSMPPPAFYALRTRWVKWDLFYKVYVTDRALHGAFLAAQVYDARSAGKQAAGPSPFGGMAQRQLDRRAKREAAYDRMVESGASLIGRDSRNFTILRTEVREVDLRVRFTLWIAARAGQLRLGTIDQLTRRFVLPPGQPADACEALARLGVSGAAIDAFGAWCASCDRDHTGESAQE